MSGQKFTWKDRDTAARDMMQLVYHSPESVRHLAMDVLQAIRSTAVISELKAIALDEGWSFSERSDALNALAVTPGDASIEELAQFVKSQFDGRWNLIQETRNSSTYNLNKNMLFSEYWMLMSVFKMISGHPINRPWLFELLEQTPSNLQCDVLCEAIGATCQQELEPILIKRLETLIEQYPDLLTLRTANEIANHGDEEPPTFLMKHIDTIISLCLIADEIDVSSVLSYSPALTAKVAETHLELAKQSSLFAYLHLHGENAVPPPAPVEPPIPKLWQQMEQLYQKAASGDEKAFMQLRELPDDYQTNILIQAAATHFLAKLWPHEHVLDRLCELVRDADETWTVGENLICAPVRFEAALALREITTPQSWEALVDLVFHRPHYSVALHLLDWIGELTDILSGAEESEISATNRRFSYWRPWVERLAELPDDLDELLQKL